MKVTVNQATPVQLNWMAAKALNYTMTEPVRATNEDAQKLTVPFTLFEVNYGYTDKGVLTRAWVSPITVTSFGVNETVGATVESISFTDATGLEALGSVSNYFLSEAEAQLEVNGALIGYAHGFSPTINPMHGIPIIEMEGITLRHGIDGWDAELEEFDVLVSGPTLLMAAMRCYVESSLGAVVEMPDDFANKS